MAGSKKLFSAIGLLFTVFAFVNSIDVTKKAADEPSEEFRALFIATVENIDWPRSRTDTPSVQQTDLVNYVQLMSSLNMNAIMFQARTTGDALYASDLEPWSKYMTGSQGQAPDPLWDPLAVLIREAHNHGIEVHAWLNPYRANMAPNWVGLAENHMANIYRQYAYPYDTYLWMDPGAAPVVDHLVSVVEDIVTRYDLDGIHMDDYFYPYPTDSGAPFPDDVTYADYQSKGGMLARADWRRSNVNTMIVRVLSAVKVLRPGCRFSISPFGLYRPGDTANGMPPPISGFDPYSEIYADANRWLAQGWIDFLAPQLYWAVGAPNQSYPMLLDWWLDHNLIRKHIYASNGVYRIDPTSSDWDVEEIVSQIDLSRDVARRNKLSQGNILFSAKYFRDNTKGISDVFKSRVYTKRATVPK